MTVPNGLPSAVSTSTTTNNSTTTPINAPTVTLVDLAQGITRLDSFCSTLTIGELHKLCQRPKELRLIYDFNNLLKSASNNDTSISSPTPATSFLHYVIQMANQCLTAINDRQCQSEMKITKKNNGKKQQTTRSKCFCSCCSHQHSLGTKEQRRPITKATNSPNAEICALLQMPQSIPSQEMMISGNEDIANLQGQYCRAMKQKRIFYLCSSM